MAVTKTEFVGAMILAGFYAAGQSTASRLGFGYEVGCLISLMPLLFGVGLLGINHLIKKRRKVIKN